MKPEPKPCPHCGVTLRKWVDVCVSMPAHVYKRPTKNYLRSHEVVVDIASYRGERIFCPNFECPGKEF